MSRTTVIVLIALGAAIAGFVLSSAAERLREDEPAAEPSAAAGPQIAELDWRETYPVDAESDRLVFSVGTLEVRRSGWRVFVSIENDTAVAWELDDPGATLDRSFGLMLLSTGDLDELEELNASGTLPEPRPATRFQPELPPVLEPGESWQGTMSASGALVAGSWVRVVFGTLFAVGNPPESLGERVVWITDHTYRLRE
jgi:hypothetical protein